MGTFTRRNRRSRALATQAIELGFAVPQVVGHRMLRMALAGFPASAADRSEFHRMGAEKLAAGVESWNAMMLEMLRAGTRLSLWWTPYFWLQSPFTMPSTRSATRRLQHAGLGILAKGVAPVHRRAIANAKRLRRKT